MAWTLINEYKYLFYKYFTGGYTAFVVALIKRIFLNGLSFKLSYGKTGLLDYDFKRYNSDLWR